MARAMNRCAVCGLRVSAAENYSTTGHFRCYQPCRHAELPSAAAVRAGEELLAVLAEILRLSPRSLLLWVREHALELFGQVDVVDSRPKLLGQVEDENAVFASWSAVGCIG